MDKYLLNLFKILKYFGLFPFKIVKNGLTISKYALIWSFFLLSLIMFTHITLLCKASFFGVTNSKITPVLFSIDIVLAYFTLISTVISLWVFKNHFINLINNFRILKDFLPNFKPKLSFFFLKISAFYLPLMLFIVITINRKTMTILKFSIIFIEFMHLVYMYVIVYMFTTILNIINQYLIHLNDIINVFTNIKQLDAILICNAVLVDGINNLNVCLNIPLFVIILMTFIIETIVLYESYLCWNCFGNLYNNMYGLFMILSTLHLVQTVTAYYYQVCKFFFVYSPFA